MANDEQQLERYLRQFHPLEPEPLPFASSRRRKNKRSARFAWVAVTAAVLIAVGTWAYMRGGWSSPVLRTTAIRNTREELQPLTVGQANTLLFKSSSVRDSLNQMAFSRAQTVPDRKRSALGVLGEEKTKL
ncbi:MAG TPA: hypothetical protein VJO35_04905 [Terriglobales bacterium]|nr:hypothetical protein [Terriglobales bacterium]